MTPKDITNYRRKLQMYYYKRSGMSDASIGRIFNLTRERVRQVLGELEEKHAEGLAQIDLFIREREPIQGILFLNALKNPVTLKGLIKKLCQNQEKK